MRSRENITSHVFDGRREFDVIVIGGGITGLWTALDATTRGYRTLLLEAEDFSSGASSKSSKLIHGGIRYLKQGRLGLVREALIEKALMFRNASHLVTKRDFLIGCYSKLDKWKYAIGIHIYNQLTMTKSDHEKLLVSPEESLGLCPTMNPRNLECSIHYSDGQVDDARFTIELCKTIDIYGGFVLNYCKVESFLKTAGRICGVVARDLETDTCHEVLAKAVINATGTFADDTLSLAERAENDLLALSRGSHIVVDQKFFPSDTALVIPETPDKRVIFVIPWLGKVLIGTTDLPIEKPTLHLKPTPEEIEYLLTACQSYLSAVPREEDILSCFAGIRPLAKGKSTKTAKLSRKHKIHESKSGLFTVAGGKYTTARKMGEDIVNLAIKKTGLKARHSKTKALKLHVTHFRNDEPMLHNNLPYSKSDFIRGIEEEGARHVMDLLARRTRAALLDASASKALIPEAARLLKKHLGKDDTWESQEITHAEQELKDFTCK